MAQLYIQKNAQPDTWVMSGAPTATTVFLSLVATINYSDGSSDSLPANTLAVLPDATTVFDRTHDVYVCYTVQSSGVLSVVKESLLPTLTSAYAPLCRIELHGIKPYQPEPYLASGGLGGAPVTTTAVAITTAGQEKVYNLGVSPGSTPPTGWQTAAFDDSAWSASALETHPSTVTFIGSPPAGAQWVTVADGTQANNLLWLLRKHFSIPPGPISAATLFWNADDTLQQLWVNGTQVTPTPTSAAHPCAPNSYALATSLLLPGATNVIALRIINDQAGLGTTGPTAWTCVLDVTQGSSGGIGDPGGHEGDLLYYHSGAWTDLPIGTSGQRLASDGTDPYWATGGSGTVTSVALAGPSGTTVSGSPITSSGTLTLAWASQTGNTFLGAPDGSSGAPTFRTLAAGDIPNLAASKITSGQLAAARGGTALDGSAAANGQLLIGNGSGYSLATLTAGSGVSVSNSAGAISISATGSGGSVTSVALTVPSVLSVSGSPVTTSGTLAVTLATQSANQVFAGPSAGSATAPTFRALSAADLPAAAAAGGHIHAHGHFL